MFALMTALKWNKQQMDVAIINNIDARYKKSALFEVLGPMSRYLVRQCQELPPTMQDELDDLGSDEERAPDAPERALTEEEVDDRFRKDIEYSNQLMR